MCIVQAQGPLMVEWFDRSYRNVRNQAKHKKLVVSRLRDCPRAGYARAHDTVDLCLITAVKKLHDG